MATPLLKAARCGKTCVVFILGLLQLVVEWLKSRIRGNP
jgi:hypothetical protein